MVENSKIEWCDHTFSPWVGCTKITPACDHCYAESWAKRAGHPELWTGERRRTTPANWRKVDAWNREASRTRRRARVFVASLSDVFDNQVDPEWREDLWTLIRLCGALDFLLRTKRPQNIVKLLPPNWGAGWPNVWLGTTVEDRRRAEINLPALTAVPARVRFVSAEPLLEDWSDMIPEAASHIDWLICGGESGGRARPMPEAWARAFRDQCRVSGIRFFMKQMARKALIPEDLMVRSFPAPAPAAAFA